jgi:hypothetical protein
MSEITTIGLDLVKQPRQPRNVPCIIRRLCPAARMTAAHFAMSASRLKRIPGRGGGEFQISNVGAET